jgi:hypothetical protein
MSPRALFLIASMSLVGCVCGPPVTSASATLEANPASLDFGTSTVGVPVTRTLTLTNQWSRAITLAEVSIDGQNALAFSVAPSSAQAIGAQQSVSLTVTHLPSSVGGQAARLLVRSDATNAELPVPLSAVAFLPDAGALDAGALDAGQDAGQPDAGQPDAGCVASPDLVFCAAHGATCGPLTANDACGVTRVVPSCGTCGAPGVCSSNVCTASACGVAGVQDVLLASRQQLGSIKAAWDGTRYGVVMSTTSVGLEFAFVSSGGVLDPTSVVALTTVDGLNGSIAFNGQEFGVVYTLYTPHSSGSTLEPWFVRVGADGSVVPGSAMLLPFNTAKTRNEWPAGHLLLRLISGTGTVTRRDSQLLWRVEGGLAWTGTELLAVGWIPGLETRLARFDASGTLVAGSDEHALGETSPPFIAVNGSEAVVMGARLVGGSNYQLFRARFTLAGVPTSAEEMLTCSNFNDLTDLGWNGFQYAAMGPTRSPFPNLDYHALLFR